MVTTGDPILDTLSTLGRVLLYSSPFLLLIWLFIVKAMWKKYPVDAVILEKRGSNLIKTNDRVGKYKDPYTDIVGYKFMKSKDTIPVIQYNWALHCVNKPTNFLERMVNLLRPTIGTMFFFRYGSKQYKPMKILRNTKYKKVFKQVINKKGKPVYNYVYQQFDPRGSLGALEFEVVDWDNMNFMVQEQRASIMRRQKQKDWIKGIAVPLAILAVATIVSIIMIHYASQWAPKISQNQNPAGQQKAEPPNIPLIGDVLPGK